MDSVLIPALLVEQSIAFQLVLFRLIAFCVMVPYLGSKNIPRRFALFFAFAFALVLTPRLSELQPIDVEQIDVQLAIVQNMVVGFLYGAAVLLVFEVITLAGAMIAQASGMAMLQMIDPSSSGNSGVISNLLNISFGILFVGSGGLMVFIEFITASFGTFPLLEINLNQITYLTLVQEFKRVFILGVMIAIPFTGAALLLNIALAVISKSAPAMNLFTIGFPLSVLLGILALALVLIEIIGDIYLHMMALLENNASAFL